MSVTPQQFRNDFSEFASSDMFPNDQIQFWLNFAYLMLNADRWGKTLDMGAELFAAHNLVIEAKAKEETKNGGIPGQHFGFIVSSSVDKVSVAYDHSAAMQEGAGHWNLSVYGLRFKRMSRMMGAGPIFVGIGAVPALTGTAWPGVINY